MPFYVYIFRDALGRIVYIGKGTGKRFQDQRRRLNRRAYVTGEIAWRTNNEDKAYRAERLLIFRHQPLWNKRPGGMGGWSLRGSNKRRLLRKYYEQAIDSRLRLKGLKRWVSEDSTRYNWIWVWRDLRRSNWKIRQYLRRELENCHGST